MSADPKDPAELWVVLDEGGNPKLVERLRITALAHSDRYQHVTPYVPKADLDAAREELELAFERGRDAGREATSELIQRTQVKPLYDELQLARAVCDEAERISSFIEPGEPLRIAIKDWKESRSRG